MKLSEWAKRENISVFTARRWIKEGRFPVPYYSTPGGQYRVKDPKYVAETTESATQNIVGYARVSSSDQKDDLTRQADRISAYIANMGENSPKVVTEVGSGMNGSRRKINKLLSDPTVGTIVVEHSDRLARMNVPLIASALEASGRRLVIMDTEEIDDDLVQEVVEFMTSIAARFHGKRSAKNRAEHAVRELTE